MHSSKTRDPDEPTKIRGEGGNYFSGGGTANGFVAVAVMVLVPSVEVVTRV